MTLMRSLWGTSSEQVRGRCVEANCSGHLSMFSLNVPGSVACKALLDLDLLLDMHIVASSMVLLLSDSV